MTAHELAKKLLEGPDYPVTISGYEGGVNIINEVNEPGDLILNVHTEWYYGKHEYARYEPDPEGKEIVKAIHLST